LASRRFLAARRRCQLLGWPAVDAEPLPEAGRDCLGAEEPATKNSFYCWHCGLVLALRISAGTADQCWHCGSRRAIRQLNVNFSTIRGRRQDQQST
jgi:hypothetical protein